MKKEYLVLDAGGTFMKYALLDEDARILEKNQVGTPKHSIEEFLKVLDTIVGLYKSRISGIAVSMPGMIDSSNGYCISGGALTYFCDTPMKELLEERYQIPAAVENDGKCAALAEQWKGSLKDCNNGAVVLLGTGVAGGLVINGRLYRGSHFTAGEYSYVLTDDTKRQDMNSFWGLKNSAEMLAKNVAAYTKEDWKSYSGVQIFERANAGEENVLKGLKDFTDILAAQIYNLNIFLDLDVVAVGGGISRQPLLFEYLEKSLDEFMDSHPIKELCPYIPKPNITNCTFYNDANLVGAMYHYFESENQ